MCLGLVLLFFGKTKKSAAQRLFSLFPPDLVILNKKKSEIL